jgi:hypothetical protein
LLGSVSFTDSLRKVLHSLGLAANLERAEEIGCLETGSIVLESTGGTTDTEGTAEGLDGGVEVLVRIATPRAVGAVGNTPPVPTPARREESSEMSISTEKSKPAEPGSYLAQTASTMLDGKPDAAAISRSSKAHTSSAEVMA